MARPHPVLYDTIGIGYRTTRVPDRRIAAQISSALGDVASVANIGAGCGSYEPTDRIVVAVEPSMTMIRQRESSAAPAVQAQASQLPLQNGCVDAVMAILTVHHWTERSRSLQECVRVARRRLVIMTWNPAGPDFWLTREYFPEIVVRDQDRFPSLDQLTRELGLLRFETVSVP